MSTTTTAETAPVVADQAAAEFTADRDEFLAAVDTVRQALPSRTTMPVLTGIRLQARPDGRVIARATDLERDVTASFPAEVTAPGEAVPAGTSLAQLLANAPKGPLHCAAGRGRFHIGWNRARFSLPAFTPDQYPDEVHASRGKSATFPGSTLARLAQVGMAAVNQDAARPVLQGIRVRATPEGLIALACDGLRVARDIIADSAWPAGTEILPPAPGLGMAARILGGAETVAASLDGSWLLLDGGAVTVRVRLLEGKYPEVESLLPGSFATTVTVGRRDLAAALERAGIVSHSATNLNVVFLRVQDGTFSCRAETPEDGSGLEDLEAEVTGEPVEVAFNGVMLREGLRRFGAEKVRLELAGPTAPLRLTGGDETFTYWQMPVRVDN